MEHRNWPNSTRGREIVGKNDCPLIRSRLLAASLSQDFEEAKGEWEVEGKSTPEDHDFTDHCELCDHFLQVLNYKLRNYHTQRVLRIGRECAKRFNFNKLTDDTDKEVFLNRLDRKDKAAREMRRLLSEVLVECPQYNRVIRFRFLAFQWLGARRQEEMAGGKWYEFVRLLGITADEDLRLISRILFDLGHVVMKRQALPKTGTEDGSWGPRKRTRASLSISRSRLDRPDHAME